MKTTIKHKVYNTDTATHVANDQNYLGGGDFRAWEEHLYLTVRGNWFVYGWGGAMTKYADHDGNHSSEGERIVPMTREEALTWCEEHNAQNAIDTHFSDMICEA